MSEKMARLFTWRGNKPIHDLDSLTPGTLTLHRAVHEPMTSPTEHIKV